MTLPKWLVFVLFAVAIGSTGGVLYLLTQRSYLPVSNNAGKLAPVMVSSLPSASVSASSSASVATTSASPLSATAEWKKYSSENLSVKLEYPPNWFVTASESAAIKITSFDPKNSPESKDIKESVQIIITREKKASSSQKLTAYLEERAKKYKESSATSAVKEENTRKIDGFDAVDRMYSSLVNNQREIVFGTKNYFYIISVSPSDTLLNAGVNELLKTLEII